ncbi:alpha/beta fold hydrolase [uncultured Tateyamaria sp.]|uniref:alpha/beta hydrolase n=1 Tax=uncultured Tateyamaria sp. TaxID=455651 RepID=UPI0026385423|nr:alpha/beta fold hydrolase [uncultured Tateyamaria sp.]
MKTFGKALGRILLILVLLIAGLWLFGPYEKAPLTPTITEIGEDLDAHFATVESRFDDITPGTEKRIVWAGDTGTQTDWSILYVHGFSATSEEIRPVPDSIATALGANLIYTRLQGHGRSSDALAEATVQGWVNDLAEGLAAARQAGTKVLILSTSTGGTLVTATAQNADLMENVAGLILVSPNYGLSNPLAKLLSWPAARHWLPPVAGQRRSFTPRNEEHGLYWTTEYPSVAVMPMAALIDAVAKIDHSTQTIPALFWYAQADEVVRPDLTAQVAQAWGAPTHTVNPIMGAQDDPQSHVISGNIMSPGQTDATVQGMLDWIVTLEN